MSVKCLKQAYLLHGLPVVLMTLVITLLGIGFLYIGSSAGYVLIMTSMVVLAVFSLLGARSGCLMQLSRLYGRKS